MPNNESMKEALKEAFKDKSVLEEFGFDPNKTVDEYLQEKMREEQRKLNEVKKSS